MAVMSGDDIELTKDFGRCKTGLAWPLVLLVRQQKQQGVRV